MFLPGISRAGQIVQTGYPPNIMTEEVFQFAPGWTVAHLPIEQTNRRMGSVGKALVPRLSRGTELRQPEAFPLVPRQFG